MQTQQETSNVAVGREALSANTTADSNTAVGYKCFTWQIQTGATENTAVGVQKHYKIIQLACTQYR